MVVPLRSHCDGCGATSLSAATDPCDVEALPELRELAVLVDDAMRAAVAAYRSESYRWGKIAERLGTTRQTAQQRYGRADNGSSIQRQGTLDGQTTIDEPPGDEAVSAC